MLNVFLTVDTEVWPFAPDWRAAGLAADVRRDFDCATPHGAFGVPYQIDVLNVHGLKAVFFVEGLCASAAGPEAVRHMVGRVRDGGQEVQLHLHPEWLQWMDAPPLPYRSDDLKDYSEDEQAVLVGLGLDHLRAAGAGPVCAFRAGNYGAGPATLPALARHGITFDTSYNFCYLNSTCGLRTPAPLLQPAALAGVWEFPITFFRDWPGHGRHAQPCACSGRELEHILMQAWRRGWYAVVLVSHSFELLKDRQQAEVPPTPDRAVIRRFERLCRFLAAHRDKFRTLGFADVDVNDIPTAQPQRPLRSRLHYTGGRLVEQLVRRLG
jgi:hypothetical protein